MTKRELEKILKQNGWEIINGTSTKIPIPRHKGDIPAGTANSILKDAGLK